VHFAVDPDSQTIVAELMTDSSVHDATAALPLLEEVGAELRAFYGDGAYDTWELREHLEKEPVSQVIPPRKNAVIQQHGNSAEEPRERDECVRQIRRDGKRAWKESIGYHRRSLAETAMSRLKTTFGDRLRNREPPNQATEVAFRTKILTPSSPPACLCRCGFSQQGLKPTISSKRRLAR
jgi:IS5 family transposase